MLGCPDTHAYFYEETKMNYVTTHYKDWNSLEDAYHCRMLFSASGTLNGKLVVRLEGIEDAEVHVFKMPKHFNKKY